MSRSLVVEQGPHTLETPKKPKQRVRKREVGRRVVKSQPAVRTSKLKVTESFERSGVHR